MSAVIHASGLAELSSRSGKVSAWNPAVESGGGGPGSVRTLARREGTIYLGGSFKVVGGELRSNPRGRQAQVRASRHAWNPNVRSSRLERLRSLAVMSLKSFRATISTLYVAGHFSRINGLDRGGLAEVDLGTGRPTSWSPLRPPRPYEFAPWVDCIALGDRTLFVGARTDSMGGEARRGFAGDRSTYSKGDGVGSACRPWARCPRGLSRPDLCGREVPHARCPKRKALAAFDTRTGELTAWDPAPDGYVHELLAVRRSRLRRRALHETWRKGSNDLAASTRSLGFRSNGTRMPT
jgi:hypothetical protein